MTTCLMALQSVVPVDQISKEFYGSFFGALQSPTMKVGFITVRVPVRGQMD